MNNTIIHQLRTAGVDLEVIKGNLKVKAPLKSLSTDLLKAIKLNEEYLVQWVSNSICIPNTKPEASSSISISEIEKKRILFGFNQAIVPDKDQLTIIDLFNKQIQKNPENTALIFKGKPTSFKELDQYSSQLANYLVQDCQLSQGDLVGIEMERGTRTIIAIIAVLKSGGVCVPIDPNCSENQKAFIYQDSQYKLTITEKMLKEDYKKIKKHSQTFNSTVDSENLAYLIYTSKYTQNLTGVQITHAALADYTTTFKDYFRVIEEDRLLQQSSISFDSSIEEIFPILISGGTLVIQETGADSKHLFEMCQDYKITILSTSPSVLEHLNQVYDEYTFDFIILISGGNVLKPEHINNIWEKVNTYNTYGPAECTVSTTYYKIRTDHDSTIPIGRPIANRQIYILDPSTHQLCPVGVSGEIYIAGEGLSQGYLNRPELTAEKFVPNPFIKNTMMYKTGDLGHWLPSGDIVFTGRITTSMNEESTSRKKIIANQAELIKN